MSDRSWKSIERWGTVIAIFLGIASIVYTAGVMGADVAHNAKNIDRIESQTLRSFDKIDRKLDQIHQILLDERKGN